MMPWSAPARLLVLRALAVIGLCYGLLLQAALAPVVRAAHAPASLGTVAALLCLTDHDDGADPAAPNTADHHDAGCCLPASRTDLASPVLEPVPPLTPPAAPSRVAIAEWPAAGARSPPSVDLGSRSARAPPTLLA